MKTLKVKWTGIRPLLMTNPQTVDALNPYTRAMKKVNKEKKDANKKDNFDEIVRIEKESSRIDWESSVYWDEELGFYIPDDSVLACLKSGAMKIKKGKDVQACVIVNEPRVKVNTKRTFKKLDDAFKDPEFVMRSPVRIPPRTGALVMKSRAIMPTGWFLEFTLDFDEKILGEQDLKEAMDNAGTLCGLGGWRPKFGRFTVEVANG